MEIDLELKSKELKDIVSQFETSMFLGAIGSMIQFISFDKPSQSLNGLSSPLRQLYYVAGLNLTSTINSEIPLRPQFTQDEWDIIKELLNEIEQGYQQFFYPKDDAEVDEDWTLRRMIAMPSFLSYFNQGPLNYEEQVIERVNEYFTPFNTEIKSRFGLEIKDFIDIYNFIDSLPNKFLDEKINHKEGQQSWEEFAQSMIEKGLTPDQWNDYLPTHFKEQFELTYDQGKMQRFTLSQIADVFGKEKTKQFLEALTCQRSETSFLYYTETNILHSKPIFQVGVNEYQCIEMKQIIHAVYNTFFEFLTKDSILKDKFYAVRGDKLEDKIESVFQKYFKNKAIVYRAYYTTEGHEQDLLFLLDGFALIVEAKASKRKEPRRDPDKAYPLILSNFDEVIQKGYDQAYRVKSKFLSNEPLELYSNQQLNRQIANINTKKYSHVFSVIVTLKRFGQLQTDLSELLEIWDDDEYPWSIAIDDLEVFLLTLDKLKKKKTDLVQFLHLREKLHEKTICSDELEICGAFLNNKITYRVASQNKTLALTPDLSSIFDEKYHHGGLGFPNEKNMELKTNDKYKIIGQ